MNENQLTVVTDKEIMAHLDNLGLTSKLTAGEKNTYLQIAKAFNLNPFKREVHVSKYGDKMSIIVGYETYIKRAERSGQLDGWEVRTEGEIKAPLKESTLKAVITIYRKDRSRPFIWEAKFTEYMQLKDGGLNQFWQKSETMIKKVAMAQGFRLCFNDELGGMPYTSEEINDIPHDEVATPVNAQPIKGTIAEASKTTKKNISAKAISDAVVRLLAGEPGLKDKLEASFTLSAAQLAEIDQAIAFHMGKAPLYALLNSGSFEGDEFSEAKAAVDRCSTENQYQELHKALTEKQPA